MNVPGAVRHPLRIFFCTFVFFICFSAAGAWAQPGCAQNAADLKAGKRGCGLIVLPVRTRYVSLAPNLTEILFAIDAQPVVGTSDQCDFPAAALQTQKIGSYSSPQFELILKANPSQVFATEGNPRALLEKLRQQGISVVEFNPKTLREVPAALLSLAKAGAMGENPKAKAAELAHKMESAINTLPGPQKTGPKALLVLQWEPVYSVNGQTWLGDILTQAGYRNVVEQSALAYPVVSQEFLIKNKPDLIFVAGAWKHDANIVAEQQRTLAEGQTQLIKLYGAKALLPKVVVLPPDIFVRPGPRLIEAIAFLKTLSRVKYP